MSQPNIELSQSLWLRVVKSAESKGFASPHSYVADVLERELGREAAPADEDIMRKMGELGYLDFGRDI